MASSASRYMVSNSEITRINAPKRMVASFLVVLMSLAVAIVGLAGKGSTLTTASANWQFVCMDSNSLGWNMNANDWHNSSDNDTFADKAPRDLTLQQAFGSNMSFPLYQGEGGTKDKGVVRYVGDDRGKDTPGYTASLDKFKKLRGVEHCDLDTGLNQGATIIMDISEFVTRVTSMAAGLAFNNKIICENDTQSNCVNLQKIVGGADSNGQISSGGIIGSLTSSVYLPLIGLAVLATAVWLINVGLIKRRYREGFFGALWLVASFVIGYALLLHPSLIARAPMSISNTATACVVGSFNGQNCMDSTDAVNTNSDAATSESTTPCYADVPNLGVEDKAQVAVNSLTCSIWKSFVLEPYSQAMFGTSYEDLETTGSTPAAAAIKKAGIDPNTFCVSVGTSIAMDKQSDTLQLDRPGRKVCNLAAYQMFLSTKASSVTYGGNGNGTSAPPTGVNDLDKRWYNVIVTAANDDAMWNSWSGNTMAAFHRLGVSFIALFASVAGCIVLGSLSAYALMYLFLSMILMAFAPLFCLIGVYPPGRRYLLGWGESVINNVLKFLISLVFLLISLAFYAAILGTVSNLILSVVMVLVLSFALWGYRNEVTGLLGRANMGGQALSNFAKLPAVQNATQKVGRTTVAMTGAAIGATLAEGDLRPTLNPVKAVKNTGRNLAIAKRGAGQGMRRSLMRNPGRGILSNIVASSLREQNSLYAANRTKVSEMGKGLESKHNAAKDNLALSRNAVSDAESKLLETHEKNLSVKQGNQELLDNESALRRAETTAIAEIAPNHKMFADIQSILNQLSNLKIKKEYMEKAGFPPAEIAKVQNNIDALEQNRDALLSKITPAERFAGEAAYTAALHSHIGKDRRLDTAVLARRHGTFTDAMDETANSEKEYREALQQYQNAKQKADTTEAELVSTEAALGKVDKVRAKMSGQSSMRMGKVRKLERKSAKASRKAVKSTVKSMQARDEKSALPMEAPELKLTETPVLNRVGDASALPTPETSALDLERSGSLDGHRLSADRPETPAFQTSAEMKTAAERAAVEARAADHQPQRAQAEGESLPLPRAQAEFNHAEGRTASETPAVTPTSESMPTPRTEQPAGIGQSDRQSTTPIATPEQREGQNPFVSTPQTTATQPVAEVVTPATTGQTGASLPSVSESVPQMRHAEPETSLDRQPETPVVIPSPATSAPETVVAPISTSMPQPEQSAPSATPPPTYSQPEPQQVTIPTSEPQPEPQVTTTPVEPRRAAPETPLDREEAAPIVTTPPAHQQPEPVTTPRRAGRLGDFFGRGSEPDTPPYTPSRLDTSSISADDDLPDIPESTTTMNPSGPNPNGGGSPFNSVSDRGPIGTNTPTNDAEQNGNVNPFGPAGR